MQTLSEIKGLLAERGLRPNRRFGQCFLHDKNQIRRLVDAAALQPGELVLEVGPGTGTLTEALIEAEAVIVAAEIDRGLASIIRDRFGERVKLVEGDCLGRGRSLAPALADALGDRPFKLVANLPYQAATTLIGVLLVTWPSCRGQFITIQKEVADRLRARPGTKAYGALTMIVGALADVGLIGELPPSCFWPAPTVTSVMFSILPRPHPELSDPAGFADFAAALFSKRRKQLGTILGRDTRWPAGVTADLRPEALTIEQVVDLHRSVPPNGE